MSGGDDLPAESPRDVEETAFTPTLRALLQAVPGALAVAFVDGEGECVDYCSVLPPFDAKVIAAHLAVVASGLRETSQKRAGEPWFLHVHGEARDFLVRRISDEYALVVTTVSCGLTSLLEEAVELAVRELRIEGGVSVPSWEPRRARVSVEVRLSTVGWAYAPKAYWQNGERTEIDDVLGRWVDLDPGRGGEPVQEAICFLVRTRAGHELTLVHLLQSDTWELR